MNKCLACYAPLEEGAMHSACSRAFFGTPQPPVLSLEPANLKQIARQVVGQRVAIAGVQPKISLDYPREQGQTRLTIVGLWGRFILKPVHPDYPFMPEWEDLCLHLAADAGLPVVPHTLLTTVQGERVYLARRIDRPNEGEKQHMEDACQLAGRLTEDKYKGSMEQVGRLLWRFSDNPGLDVVRLYELTLFCFLTGNSDMHLKNFSLLDSQEVGWHMAAAYDLVPTNLLLPQDSEELALPLGGKKARFKQQDFLNWAAYLQIPPSAEQQVREHLLAYQSQWLERIKRSFLPREQQEQFWALVQERVKRLV